MTAADWTAQNPLLAQFEMGIEVDAATGAYTKAKLGNGRTLWNDLPYFNPAGSEAELTADELAAIQGAATAPTALNPFVTEADIPGASANNVVDLEGDGAPTSGASGTGDNVAGPGSRYTDYTNANLYIQTGLITAPAWKLVVRES